MSTSYLRQTHGLTIMQHFCPNFPPHLHRNLELLFILKGSGDAYCDGEHYTLKPGDMFLAYPNQVHSFANFPEDGHSFAFMIPPEHIGELNHLIHGKCPVSAKATPENKGRFTALLKFAWDVERDKTYNSLLKEYASLVFKTAIDSYTLRESALNNDTVSQILDYCSEHFNENISVSDISAKFFVSRSTVSRIFSNRINLSFNDYVNSLRISEFLSLMQKGKLSITDAAIRSGFSTVRTFNGAFKKQYGMTPSEYLNKLSK